MIKVAIADDHKLFREGVRFMLDQMYDIEYVYEASNGRELLQEFQLKGPPDVVLLDLDMPELDGIETLKVIEMEYREVGVIILTMYEDRKMIAYLMELGANGYLLKDTNHEELQKAIEAVYREGMYFNNMVSKAVLSGLQSNNQRKPTLKNNYVITAREKEVLELICQGMTAKEIADKLFISHRTAEGHRRKLIEKLGVRNTAELIVKAMKEGLVNV